MKDTATWLSEIEEQIKGIKSRGFHAYFSPLSEMSKETAQEIKRVYGSDKEYDFVEVKSCNCKKKTYDVMITWRET